MGVPVVLILQDVTSNARFLSYSLLVFTFPVTTAALIVLPKVLTVRRMTRMANTDESEHPMGTVDTSPRRGSNDIVATNPASASEGATRVAQTNELPHSPRIQVVTFD